MKKKPLVVLTGPTAVGKTKASIGLAKAIGGEIISADSMQVYDDVWVGTARPTPAEQQGIVHHLQGFLPLQEPYSVARYVEDAYRAFDAIYAQEKTPVLCGGTGLYIQSFMENIQFFPQPGDPRLRQELLQIGREQEALEHRLGRERALVRLHLRGDIIDKVIYALVQIQLTALL